MTPVTTPASEYTGVRLEYGIDREYDPPPPLVCQILIYLMAPACAARCLTFLGDFSQKCLRPGKKTLFLDGCAMDLLIM
jgi:hypothetical protein